MPQQDDFGTGMKFPPQINKGTGRFAVSSGKENVRESIYLILMTQRTERFLRPDFGSDLMSYPFMDINVSTVNILIRSLREQILSQEPRIRNLEITTDSQVRDGCLLINIDYEIREQDVSDSMVFPLYLEQFAEDEAYEPNEYEEEF